MNPSRNQTNGPGGFHAGGLTGLATSLRAQYGATDDGFLLEIEPLSVVEAFRLWPEVAPEDASTVLVAIDDANDEVPPALRGQARFGVVPCERLDENAVIVPADRLARMAIVTPADALVAVAIDGPVEPADAEAIRRSIRTGGGVLAVEVRALLAATAIGERALRIETRDKHLAAAFVADGIRRYVANLLHRWPVDIAIPEPRLVLSALERTGHLSIRAIETEIYPTSIDIGLGTHADGAAQPAQTSLIFDICSGTWHGE